MVCCLMLTTEGKYIKEIKLFNSFWGKISGNRCMSQNLCIHTGLMYFQNSNHCISITVTTILTHNLFSSVFLEPWLFLWLFF